jgi:hypothetical protein
MAILGFDNSVDDRLAEIEVGLNVVRPSPNQSLFRYIGLNNKSSWGYLEETLNNFTLRGSLATSLNDPFEQNPCVFDDLTPTLLEQFRQSQNPLVAPEVGLLSEQQIADYRKGARDFLGEEQRSKRLIAFYERSDSPLLWSHYANSYKGACLHFLGGRISKFRDSFPALFGKVQYSVHRPIYPLSLALAQSHYYKENFLAKRNSLPKAESEKLLFFWKSIDWAHENEFRIVYNGQRTPEFPFNPESLASIIVGPRMPSKDFDRLISLVQRSKLPKLKIRRAAISESSFNVQIDWRD